MDGRPTLARRAGSFSPRTRFPMSRRSACSVPDRCASTHDTSCPASPGILVVKVTLNFPGTIMLESGLSFLGLGIQPPLASLGLMLGTGREYLLLAWWLAGIPGVAIFLTTRAGSLFGDWLRDRLDPALRGQ